MLESKADEVLVGAARLFFFEQLAALLPKEHRGSCAAKLCRVVLRRDRCGNAGRAVRALGSFPCPETVALLEQVAGGRISTEARSTYHKDEPSLRSAACLILAKLGSENVEGLIKAVEQSGDIDTIDKAALRIARSFTGERGLLDKEVFEIDSYTVGFGALAALEREGGRNALDVIIMGGTTHGWAAIREEAVLTVERMTGQRWYQHQENERAEWHGKDIRQWWQANRDSYTVPKTETDNKSE